MKNDLSSAQSDPGAVLLPRRQFLVLGSAAVAAAAASSLSADIVRGALVPEQKTPRISVGYAGATIGEFDAPSFAPRLTAATKLRSGDPALADGVRLKVHGLVRPQAAQGANISMALDAMYRVSGHADEVPFMAWSYARRGQHITSSAAGEFVVPVSTRQPLSLGISTSAPAPVMDDATLRATVNLSLGESRLANKLRAGLYFVAICPAGSEAPHWASIHAVAPEHGTVPVLKQRTLLGLEPVPFDYIVVAAGRA